MLHSCNEKNILINYCIFNIYICVIPFWKILKIYVMLPNIWVWVEWMNVHRNWVMCMILIESLRFVWHDISIAMPQWNTYRLFYIHICRALNRLHIKRILYNAFVCAFYGHFDDNHWNDSMLGAHCNWHK